MKSSIEESGQKQEEPKYPILKNLSAMECFPDETPQILLNFYETQQVLRFLSEKELRNIFEANRHLFSYLNFAEFSCLVLKGNPYEKDSFIINFLKNVPNPLQFRA